MMGPGAKKPTGPRGCGDGMMALSLGRPDPQASTPRAAIGGIMCTGDRFTDEGVTAAAGASGGGDGGADAVVQPPQAASRPKAASRSKAAPRPKAASRPEAPDHISIGEFDPCRSVAGTDAVGDGATAPLNASGGGTAAAAACVGGSVQAPEAAILVDTLQAATGGAAAAMLPTDGTIPTGNALDALIAKLQQ